MQQCLHLWHLLQLNHKKKIIQVHVLIKDVNMKTTPPCPSVCPRASVSLLCCISASISQFVSLARRRRSAASCTSDWRVHIIHFNIYSPPSLSPSLHPSLRLPLSFPIHPLILPSYFFPSILCHVSSFTSCPFIYFSPFTSSSLLSPHTHSSLSPFFHIPFILSLSGSALLPFLYQYSD